MTPRNALTALIVTATIALSALIAAALPSQAAPVHQQPEPIATVTLRGMTLASPIDATHQDAPPIQGLHIPTIAELTPALLSAIVAALVSLLFRFWPAARAWFDAQPPDYKQSFMFAVTAGIAAIIGAVNMARSGISEESLVMLGLTLYAALTANQTTYQFIKPHSQPRDPDIPF